MTTSGWRKRQIADLHFEIDKFEEVMSDRILIEDEITILESMIYNASGNVNGEMGIDLKASLAVAKAKLKALDS
jgi:hypothetical protein